MLVRMFGFRVRKGRERATESFMLRKAMGVLKRIGGCRQAYFLRSREKKGEYMWVTVWASEAALKKAMGRKDWQALVKEETAEFFVGKAKVRHYGVAARK